MKKLILLLILSWSISSTLKAQPPAKTDTTKVKPAPVYQPDLNSKHDIVLKGISIDQLNDWVIYSSNKPEDISNSDKISAKTATRIFTNYLLVSTQLKNQVDTLLAADKLKWQADTAKKSKSTKH
jgi:hypothetical protein